MDENFDTTDDEFLDADEIAAVTKIDVYEKGVSDLKGVECFTALEELNCFPNQLTTLDVSHNTALTHFNCMENALTSLDGSQNALLTNFTSSGNAYDIDLIGNTFDLSTLSEYFDMTKASGWLNATVEGNTLTVSDPTADVTYIYDLGNGSTETFTLTPVSCTLTEDMVQAIEDQTYTGSEIEPATIMCGEYTLIEGVDYTITYENNVNTGTASAVIRVQATFTRVKWLWNLLSFPSLSKT